MTADEILEAAKALPREEQIKLAEDLWELADGESSGAELSPEQAAELDRRIAEFEANPHEGIPLSQVNAELKQRYGWK